MILIAGLGNPGKEYEKTRHNAGFLYLEYLRQSWQFPEWKEDKTFKAEISQGVTGSTKIILARPVTFMNASGEAVQAICHFYKIPPKHVIIVHDELDLEFGTIKWRMTTETGSAGHNGIASISECLGSQAFARMKIGITTSAKVEFETGKNYVLARFSDQELKSLSRDIFPKIDAVLVTNLTQILKIV